MQPHSADADFISLRHEMYECDCEKLRAFQREEPYRKHAKYFTKCKMSSKAVIKMIRHCATAATYNEEDSRLTYDASNVMGFLIGRPQINHPEQHRRYALLLSGFINQLHCDFMVPLEITMEVSAYYSFDLYRHRFPMDTGHSIIVTDCIELPVENVANRYVADDEEVTRYLTRINDRLKRTNQNECVIGWYHTHFWQRDRVFLVRGDVDCQQWWQTMFGPFVGIIVNPMQCLRTKKPEFLTFMAYYYDYHQPNRSDPYSDNHPCLGPDGVQYESEQEVRSVFGDSWNRYYLLQNQYFMHPLMRRFTEIIDTHHLYMQRLMPSKQRVDVFRGYNMHELANLIERIAKDTAEKEKVQHVMNLERKLVTGQCMKNTAQVIKHNLFNADL